MRINLKKLIHSRGIDKSHLAQVLYPDHKHPSMALTRLIAGRSKLQEEQIFRLSMFTGLSVDALYSESMHWKRTEQAGLIRFSLDNYSAIYSPATGITKIYHLDSLLATHVLSKTNQPLGEYLSEINQIVINKSIQK